MYKNLISSILVLALLNLVGCYSNVIVTPNQYKKNVEKGDAPREIIVKLSNHKEYLFGAGRYIIKGDSLYGKGAELINDNYQPFEGSIPISHIKSIQYEIEDKEKTTKVTVAVVVASLAILVVVAAGSMVKGVGEGLSGEN